MLRLSEDQEYEVKQIILLGIGMAVIIFLLYFVWSWLATASKVTREMRYNQEYEVENTDRLADVVNAVLAAKYGLDEIPSGGLSLERQINWVASGPSLMLRRGLS